MGIILIMSVQMILAAESNAQVSNAEQYGRLAPRSASPAAFFLTYESNLKHIALGWTSMQRDRRPEVMDQPGLDPVEHDRALQGLRRINRIRRCVPTLCLPMGRLPLSPPPILPLPISPWRCGVVARW